jgi:hypothetical protein
LRRTKETPLHTAGLALIETASAAPVPVELWPLLFHQLLAYVHPESASLHANANAHANGLAADDVKAPATPVRSSAATTTASATAQAPSSASASASTSGSALPLSATFGRNALRALVHCYRATPREVAAAHFERIVAALSDCIAATAQAFGSHADLCREAVTTFAAVLEKGLPAVNAVGASDGVTLRVWALIADTLSAFLSERFHSTGTGASAGAVVPAGTVPTTP